MEEEVGTGTEDCKATNSCGPSSVLRAVLLEDDIWQQSLMAAKQLGVIVGVALLVGGMFMLVVGLELIIDWPEGKCQKICGRKKTKEQEPDAAALVGSFKRYK